MRNEGNEIQMGAIRHAAANRTTALIGQERHASVP